MTNNTQSNEIWFIYDGECPLCRSAALALRIKQKYGTLNLLNAREAADHPLILEINKRNLDLDEGMIIIENRQFHHGRDALRFMARFGDNKSIFNLVNKALYWSDSFAKLTYPWLRGIRNALLRHKKVNQIDNLNLKAEPIFKSVFGDRWNGLPTVIKKHYSNRPYTQDETIVEGILNVKCSGPIQWFAWVFWLMRGIPPHTENNVPVTVHFRSEPNTKYFHFDRIFHFQTRKPYRFHSRMIHTHSNEMIEIMWTKLGWRMNYLFEDGKVQLKHKGYVLCAFGHFIPLPITFLFGKGYAEEVAIDDNTFDMSVTITHPLWGDIYGYKGRFQVKPKK